MSTEFTTHTYERFEEKYYHTTHPSGLEIYVLPKKTVQKIALLGVRFGSVYERGLVCDGETSDFPDGIAHFLEHKLFADEGKIDAAEELAALGADANAYTSSNKTVYTASFTENSEDVISALVRFVLTPYFTEENVESEREIINREIKMCIDNPYDAVSLGLMRAMYGEGKLSVDVLGTEESISEINPKLLTDCYRAVYRPSNMVLAVCGDVEAETVLRAASRALGEREAQSAPILPRIPTRRSVDCAYIERDMSLSSPIFEIGIKDGTECSDAGERMRRDIAMTVLDEIIFSRAGELYSRLFEGGYINDSYSYGYSLTREAAFHSIYAEGDDPRAVLDMVIEETEKIKREGIQEKDFLRAKRIMLAEYARGFDSPDEVAGTLIGYALDGGDIFEYGRAVESLTLEAVQACLDESFERESFALSVVR